MSQFHVRTDLAVEARDYVMDAKEELRGIRVEEVSDGDVHVTTVYIETKNASKAMGKPMGTYITIEAGRLEENDEEAGKILLICLYTSSKDLEAVEFSCECRSHSANAHQTILSHISRTLGGIFALNQSDPRIILDFFYNLFL